MQSVVILFQVCFPVSRAHSDVALCDMAIDISQCKTDELLIDKKKRTGYGVVTFIRLVKQIY